MSYLTARPSNDIRAAACQNITFDWWKHRRADIDLYVSEFVVVEASRGNQEAAARRLAVIAGIAELEVTVKARDLAQALISEGSLGE